MRKSKAIFWFCRKGDRTIVLEQTSMLPSDCRELVLRAYAKAGYDVYREEQTVDGRVE